LHFRRDRREVFEQGDYRPLRAEGERAGHVVAFARQWEGAAAVTIVGRHFIALGVPERDPVGAAAWGETRVLLEGERPARYRDEFTGRIVEPRRTGSGWALALAEVCSHLPVALLERIR
jgi:(1->4)-alpha-D-glucan 1-alpha-D-glucosylmutase